MNALLRALRSFGQGASNAVASNVSFPVDAIAWALRKGGLPIPQNPVGGSDWMAQQGLTATPQNRIAGLLGETAGMVGPAVVQAAAPKIASGLLALDDKAMDMARRGVENYMDSTGMRQNMILYHGSNSKKPIKQIEGGGVGNVFDGLFSSPNKVSALSHGDNLYRMTVPDKSIFPHGDVDGLLPQEKIAAALNKITTDEGTQRLIMSGEGAFSRGVDEEKLLRELGVEDLSAADWELQRLRGVLAKRLGYKAAAMPDEHGISYLVLPGTKPRPANESAKEIWRNGVPIK